MNHTNLDEKLDKLISNHAYEVYLTHDLPAEEQDKEQLRLHNLYKQEFLRVTQQERVDENTSDGYHTFKELYAYRMIYNALLFTEWAKAGKYDIHKSWKHSDGELCFGGGWFVVTAQLPTGQVTNHYEESEWDRFDVPERETAIEWDGHTPQEAYDRLATLQDKKS